MTTKPETIFCCPKCSCTDITERANIKTNCTPNDRVGDVVTRLWAREYEIFKCPECEDEFFRAHEVVIATKECLTCLAVTHGLYDGRHHKIHKFIPEAER